MNIYQDKSKFYGIKYPIFCLKRYPEDVIVKLDTLEVLKDENGSYQTIDVYKENKTVLERYLTSNTSFRFDYTCRNITELARAKPKWGLDFSAKIIDLRKPYVVKARNVKIIRVMENLIWVNSVSYPIELPTTFKYHKDLKDQWVTIMYIDYKWEIYSFTSFEEEVKKLHL